VPGVKILLYHSVGRIDPGDSLGIRVDTDVFSEQMEFLKGSGSRICSLKEAVAKIEAGRVFRQDEIAITFDDGYIDNLTNAVPILDRSSFSATFFITVDYIGKVKTHRDRAWQRWKCMDCSDLKALAAKGYDIGSHSMHHVDLRELPRTKAAEELSLSRRRLGRALARDIDLFSYPYGYFDDSLAALVKEAGYRAACTTESGVNRAQEELFTLKRIEIKASDTGASFRKKIEKSYE